MSTRRPWKVRYHYDGTRIFPNDSGMFIIDTTSPINGLHANAEEAGALKVARAVSRNGGSARVFYRAESGEETTMRQFGPYEVALAEAVEVV